MRAATTEAADGARPPSGSPPASRPSRAARCAAAAWPGRCSPSRSTRPSRPSACTSAAATATCSRRSCATASPPASCRAQDTEATAAALVGAIGEALVGPLSPTRQRRRPRAPLIASLVSFCLAQSRERRAHMQCSSPAPAPESAPTRSSTRPPPLDDYNVFEADRALREAVRPRGRRLGQRRASRAVGAICGRADADRAGGVRRTRTRRSCKTHDRYGNRVDEVEFHPAWHELMALAVEHGAPRAALDATRSPAPTSRAAPPSCASRRPRPGVGCPISMTYSVVPALRHQPELAAEWEPRLTSHAYDPRNVPATEKPGALCGHGDDREAGRLRRARQHDASPGR